MSSSPAEVSRPLLLRYQRHLFHYRKANGRPFSFQSQRIYLCAVRAFFKFLVRQSVLLYNPAGELDMPKTEVRIPRHVMTVAEAEAVLAQPNTKDGLGVRDRAIMEVLYSTGMRRLELLNLRVYDLDLERGTALVRQGKGKKDRMVPIGERALAWTEKYLREVRPRIVLDPDDGTLFLGMLGEPLVPTGLGVTLSRYIAQANVGKQGSCHIWRHTCATLMLEGGADVRFIQELLGHVSLRTTQVYTQVSIKRLKAIHSATHPSARLERPGTHVPEDPAEPADPDPPVGAAPSERPGPGAGLGPGPSGEAEGERVRLDPATLKPPVTVEEEEGQWPQKNLWTKWKNRS
jgi:integrase/recombinase XerD